MKQSHFFGLAAIFLLGSDCSICHLHPESRCMNFLLARRYIFLGSCLHIRCWMAFFSPIRLDG